MIWNIFLTPGSLSSHLNCWKDNTMNVESLLNCSLSHYKIIFRLLIKQFIRFEIEIFISAKVMIKPKMLFNHWMMSRYYIGECGWAEKTDSRVVFNKVIDYQVGITRRCQTFINSNNNNFLNHTQILNIII